MFFKDWRFSSVFKTKPSQSPFYTGRDLKQSFSDEIEHRKQDVQKIKTEHLIQIIRQFWICPIIGTDIFQTSLINNFDREKL